MYFANKQMGFLLPTPLTDCAPVPCPNGNGTFNPCAKYIVDPCFRVSDAVVIKKPELRVERDIPAESVKAGFDAVLKSPLILGVVAFAAYSLLKPKKRNRR